MIYCVQTYLGQGSGDWRPKKWNTSSKLWVNFDWVAECEYLIREAKCWQTCLADMPTTKYKLWSKQGLIWNTFWIIAINNLNVLVRNIWRSTLFCSAHKWPLVFKKKALTIRCWHKQSNWMAEVPKSRNVQVFWDRQYTSGCSIIWSPYVMKSTELSENWHMLWKVHNTLGIQSPIQP